jgi:hypothetical protein
VRPEGLSKLKKINSPHLVSNPLPSDSKHSALTTTPPRVASLWFLSTLPGKYRVTTSNRPRPLPSKSFPINFPHDPTLYSLVLPIGSSVQNRWNLCGALTKSLRTSVCRCETSEELLTNFYISRASIRSTHSYFVQNRAVCVVLGSYEVQDGPIVSSLVSKPF